MLTDLIKRFNIPIVLFRVIKMFLGYIYFLKKVCVRRLLIQLLLLKIIVNMKKCYSDFRGHSKIHKFCECAF